MTDDLKHLLFLLFIFALGVATSTFLLSLTQETDTMTNQIVVDLCAGPDHHFKEDSVVEFCFEGGKFRVKFENGKLDINLQGNAMERLIVVPQASNVILLEMQERE